VFFLRKIQKIYPEFSSEKDAKIDLIDPRVFFAVFICLG